MPYFEKEGAENTLKTVELALAAAKEHKISHIVVATTTGATPKHFKNHPEVKVVAVTHSFGFKEKGQSSISVETRKELTDAGIVVLTATHALSGVERGLSAKASGVYPAEIIAHALRFFGQGTKVAVEIATSALDAGLIPADVPIIAIGGTKGGADTALILTPANSSRILETRVHRVVAKPL